VTILLFDRFRKGPLPEVLHSCLETMDDLSSLDDAEVSMMVELGVLFYANCEYPHDSPILLIHSFQKIVKAAYSFLAKEISSRLEQH